MGTPTSAGTMASNRKTVRNTAHEWHAHAVRTVVVAARAGSSVVRCALNVGVARLDALVKLLQHTTL